MTKKNKYHAEITVLDNHKSKQKSYIQSTVKDKFTTTIEVYIFQLELYSFAS